MTLQTPHPCGAIRVVRWFEGMAQAGAWCSRRSGPCHYPGAGVNLTRNGRACVVEFAKNNQSLCSDAHHDKGHGGMFPETCTLCAAQCEEPRPTHLETFYRYTFDLPEEGQ